MSLFDSVASRVTSGIKKSIPSMSSIGMAVGKKLIGKYAPKAYGPLTRALRGDISGAISDSILGFAKGKISSALSLNPLLGGITLNEAAMIASTVQSTSYARKNLFFIEIKDSNPPAGFEDISYMFNLFAIDVSFGPNTVLGETKNIGMGVMDVVTGTDRIEMRITTYDDSRGTIKSWFEAKFQQVSHPDGTGGVPYDYLIQFDITQSATEDIGAALLGSYRNTFIMRPVSREVELSRSEDGLEQIQMTFCQFDTFMFKGS